jgi:YD repeat-containing protein
MSKPNYFYRFYGLDERSYNSYPAENVVAPCSGLVRSSASTKELGSSAMGGLVGYDSVSIYYGEMGIAGKSTFIYNNDAEANQGCSDISRNWPYLPTKINLLNGVLLKQKDYSYSSGEFKIVRLLENNYQYGSVKTYPALQNTLISANSALGGSGVINVYGLFYYKIQSQWSYLINQTEKIFSPEGKIFETSTNFYYENPTHYQLTKKTFLTSDDKSLITRYKYPLDFSRGLNSTIDKMQDNHLIAPIIEEQNWKNNKLISGNVTSYNVFNNNMILPYKVYYLRTNQPLSTIGNGETLSSFFPFNTLNITHPYELENQVNYDNKGNLIEINKKGSDIESYIWGYNQSYPILKAENTSYSVLNAAYTLALSTAGVTDFNEITDPGSNDAQKTKLKNFVQSIQSNNILAKNMISIYTYSPLIGMTSQTDPNGVTTYYEYDDFGRLKCLKDDDGRILKTYEYNYKQ